MTVNDCRKLGFQKVHLRVEGSTSTIFEDITFSRGHVVTTPQGGAHKCDGTNLNANPTPGNTPTAALDTASKLKHFPFDSSYNPIFDDFFITSIGPDTETSTKFWGLLVNFKFTSVGGCQRQTAKNDEVLWAFNAFNALHFLKLDGPNDDVRRNQAFVVTVTDGSTGQPVAGATVKIVAGATGTATTDAAGHASFTLGQRGKYSFKAEAPSSIRSNAEHVRVS